MSNVQHTPGPWTIHEGGTTLVIFGPYRLIAVMDECGAQAEADACLIAAAPDMLAAHGENARILSFLCGELQGRIDAGKLAALSACAGRCRAAIARAAEA